MDAATKKTVFVGMSGGVDSSVTAFLLKGQGYDVVGVFMRCYNIDGCAERDAEDARRVAEHLNIPFYVWDFEEEYKQRVVKYMIDGYRTGITPNPDVMCNREVKFGLFLEKAIAMGADFVATGHYVKVAEANGKYSLFEAKDGNKDQSYFIWTLTQEELKYCLFPIGAYIKSEVREVARKAGLPTAEKKDSQGICFLGQVSIEEFLSQYISGKPGALVTTSGEKIGEHSGAEFYTIGQRHIDAQFAFPKTGGAVARKPYYVAAKDVLSNTVTVAEGSENPALYKDAVTLAQVNFIKSLIVPENGLPVRARVRYRQPLSEAILKGSFDGGYAISFSTPQKFVAPGQSAVFYSHDGEMLGGGIIL